MQTKLFVRHRVHTSWSKVITKKISSFIQSFSLVNYIGVNFFRCWLSGDIWAFVFLCLWRVDSWGIKFRNCLRFHFKTFVNLINCMMEITVSKNFWWFWREWGQEKNASWCNWNKSDSQIRLISNRAFTRMEKRNKRVIKLHRKNLKSVLLNRRMNTL